MATADGMLRITFNGEIYNYRALKKELESKGYLFHSNSDTEVLLHLYADRGQEMVHALRGMYAFSIWDERKNGMFLARDPFGIKPLYYSDDGATIRIASQVKALLAGGTIDTTEEPAGHASFFLFGSVVEPFTLYRRIRALPAGSSLWVDGHGAAEPRCFFRIADEFAVAEANRLVLSEEDLGARIAEALRDTVRHHMVADVPIGVFLSSGIDSSSLVGLACSEGFRNLRTMTLGFREYQGTANDETPLANAIASHYGTNHRTRWVEHIDFERDADALLKAMDQPSIDGVNSWFVAKTAAECGMKVALSGLGGDEIFGGYSTFQSIPRMKKWLAWSQFSPALGQVARRATSPILKHITSPKYAGLLEYGGTYSGAYLLCRGLFMPWELADVMGTERARGGLDTLQPLLGLDQTISGIKGERPIVAALELQWYMRCQLLRDADWAGMAHSLEVRVPFVDVQLLRVLAPTLVSSNPPRKRHIWGAPARALPDEVLNRIKTGFATPVQGWLAKLRPSQPRERGLRGWARLVHREQWIRPKKVLISTLNPAGGGGVTTMTRKVVDFLSHRGYEVALAYSMPYRSSPELSVSIRKLLWKSPLVRSAISFGSVLSFEFGARVPGLQCLRCFPSNRWKQVVSQFDYHVAVSGSALEALPILLQNKRCLAWVATPYVADKVDRVRFYPWYRRILDVLVDTPICRLMEKVALRNATILALSDYTATALRRIEPRGSATIMPMPIDVAMFHPMAEHAQTRNRIGFAGRFTDPRKNIMLLFDAVAACHARGVRVTCELVGDDPLPEFNDYLRARNLSGYVSILGHVERGELCNYYNNLDIFVIPSYQEGLGIVGLEAMACGCPVVATRCGGTEDYVRDDVNGYLVGFSADAMADAIIHILSDPELHRSLRAGALQTIRQDYFDAGVERVFWRQFEATFGKGAL